MIKNQKENIKPAYSRPWVLCDMKRYDMYIEYVVNSISITYIKLSQPEFKRDPKKSTRIVEYDLNTDYIVVLLKIPRFWFTY